MTKPKNTTAPASAVPRLGAPIFLAVRAHQKTRDAKARRRLKAALKLCLSCGAISARAKGVPRRGNNTLEWVLWLCLLVPLALVYSVWRRVDSGASETCPVCACSPLVPAFSDAAIAYRRSIGKAPLNARWSE